MTAYGDGEMLGVDLGELLAAAVILVVGVHHGVAHLARPHPVDLEHLLRVGVVGVQGAELQLAVAEQNQEVRTLAPEIQIFCSQTR